MTMMTKAGAGRMLAEVHNTELLKHLRLGSPGDGFVHFPMGAGGGDINGIDANYFDMLTAEKRVIEDVARDILLKYAAHRIIDFIRAPHNDQKLVLTNRHLHGARQTKEEQIQN